MAATANPPGDRPRILVVTGDHGLPDPTKRDSRYNEEDRVTHDAMVAAFSTMDEFAFTFCSSHATLLDDLRASPPDLVAAGIKAPMCMDSVWMEWAHAWEKREPFTPRGLGVSYMLAGDGGATPQGGGRTKTVRDG